VSTTDELTRSRAELAGMLFGFQPAQVLYAAAELGLADLVADDARTSADLAAATGTDADALHRLLRAMAGLGLVDEVEPGRFRLAAHGLALRSGPQGLRSLALLFGGEHVWRPWGLLVDALRRGSEQVVFEDIYGQGAMAYYAERPELAVMFNDAMTEATTRALPGIVAAYDWSGFTELVDVGGGNGTLMAAVLTGAPALRGVVLDTAAGLTDTPAHLDAAGVADRCRLEAGDFFAAVPAGADGYVLKSVIHDWDDTRSATILGHCRRAIAPGGRLVIVEPVLPERIEHPGQMAGMLLSDLNMLLLTGGRERTQTQFGDLLAGAGFELTAVVACEGSDYSIVEARPTG
jgi:SAM-dependent methyltransferase